MKCVLSSVASCVHVEVREASMPGSECRCMDVGMTAGTLRVQKPVMAGLAGQSMQCLHYK